MAYGATDERSCQLGDPQVRWVAARVHVGVLKAQPDFAPWNGAYRKQSAARCASSAACAPLSPSPCDTTPQPPGERNRAPSHHLNPGSAPPLQAATSSPSTADM